MTPEQISALMEGGAKLLERFGFAVLVSAYFMARDWRFTERTVAALERIAGIGKENQ